jgi:hypothetical protein
MSKTGSRTALAAALLAFFLSAVATPWAAEKKEERDDRPVVKREHDEQTQSQAAALDQSVNQTEPGQADSSVPGSPEAPAASDSRAGEEVHWQAITSGGGRTTVGTYRLVSSIGQPAVGLQTMGSYTLRSGFLQDFGTSDYCCEIRGDINHDGSPIIDIVDLVYMVNYMFKEGPEPICFWEADINGDGSPIIDIVDLVYMVNYMFKEGPDPVPCP